MDEVIKVVVSEYRIEMNKKNIHIHVRVHKDGRCSISTRHQSKEFIFLRSNPEMAMMIGELLVKAGEVAQRGREEVIEK